MKRKDVLSLETGDYETKLAEFRKELIKLNAQASTGTAAKNPGLLRQTKKNVARMLTLINQKNERRIAKK
ncbi:50S ribosomal protein L29 [Candidatus Woesearchaeota archaeon]|nr:50S ribosomal protein L29 [Candidatus Woesearchaeota archaeon]